MDNIAVTQQQLLDKVHEQAVRIVDLELIVDRLAAMLSERATMDTPTSEGETD